MRAIRVLVVATAVFLGGLAVGSPAQAADPPELTVGDVSLWEGDAGFVNVKVPIDLSKTPLSTVVVEYTASTGSAAAGTDFVARKGRVTFRPGSMPSKQVAVKVLGDTTSEAGTEEQVVVRVTSVTGADPVKAEGSVTILEDDHATPGVAGPVEVGIGDFSAVEADSGQHLTHLPVTLSSPATETIKVSYGIECSTAFASSDYSAKKAGTITFKPGQRSKTLPFKVTADVYGEDLIETVSAEFSVVGGAMPVRGDDTAATIMDNDSAPSVRIERASVASSGEEGTAPSECEGDPSYGQPSTISGADLTPDGRYVAFSTAQHGLDPADTNYISDVFVRDLVNHTTERVSLKNDGSQYTGNLWGSGAMQPSISADARYVAYIVSNGLFLRDRVAGTTQTITGGGALYPSISADGSLVAYNSLQAQTATPIPRGQGQDAVYVWNRDTNVTSLVTVRSPNEVGGWWYNFGKPVISGNGRYVAFTDGTDSHVAGDTNNCADTFVRDLQTGATQRVSVMSGGAQQVTDWEQKCSYGDPVISSDGRFVGFSSAAWNLYPGATTWSELGSGTPSTHAYLHDTQLATTQLVEGSENAIDNEAHMSAVSDDGRYAVFGCDCGSLVPGYTNSFDHASIWRDLDTGDVLQIGVQNDGTEPVEPRYGRTYTMTFGISADGLTVGFTSWASNLVGDDHNGAPDAFVEFITP